MPYERRGPRPTRWQMAAVRRGARLPIEAGVGEHLTHDRLQRGRLQVCGQRLGGSPGLGPRGGEVCLGEEERQQPRRRQLVAACEDRQTGEGLGLHWKGGDGELATTSTTAPQAVSGEPTGECAGQGAPLVT